MIAEAVAVALRISGGSGVGRGASLPPPQAVRRIRRARVTTMWG
jgi:hypothetical protein